MEAKIGEPSVVIEHPYDITMEELKKKEDFVSVEKEKENKCPICGLYICECKCVVHKKEDMVNSPKHYTFGKIEVITVIDDWELGFYEGQVIKYVGRAKHKGNELQDLKKAQWYLNRLIDKKDK